MTRAISTTVLALVLMASALPAEEPFGTFNLRTGLFRRLFRPFVDKATPTRYPIVLAHGICGFDKLRWGPIEVRYFHGIEQHLRERGFDVFTSDVPPTGSIEARATALAEQIRRRYPDGKVNILAHSMGGLDTRYMIARLGMADRIASVTMVSTPNHGTLLADWFVYYAQQRFPSIEKLAKALGIDLAGFHDLSVRHMELTFNPAVPDDPRVVYRSLAGAQKFRNYFVPLMATHAINRALEKTLLRQPLDAGDGKALRKLAAGDGRLVHALSEKGFQEALRDLPREWLRPELAGRTDGMVGMSSARRGQYLGDLDADHLDEMGWLTTFDAKGLYEALATRLAEDGY
ncbi:MAG: alpha/beta fold hydrolase [Candidatus Wallbacteria bacterium]|nr:alpha/beta fold hydrolase [Candidatus Wallbacteria bacterium]